MPFFDVDTTAAFEPAPGCRLRTPSGHQLMLSYLEMDAGAEIPMHHHPHEQGGMVIEGRLELTIGAETRVVERGTLFFIPSNTPHRAVAVDGPVTVLDAFSPVRREYQEQMEQTSTSSEARTGTGQQRER